MSAFTAFDLLDNSDWVNPVLHDFHVLKRKYLQSGAELIDLSMINPDISPQRVLIDRLLEATVKAGQHRYTLARGVNMLRSAFAEKYLNRFSVKLNPESQICVTAGSKDALNNVLACLIPKKKIALVASPAYPAHVSALNMNGYQVKYFSIAEDEVITISNLFKAIEFAKPDLILLNFPNNPTGQVVSKHFWQLLIEQSRKHKFFIINDFVYGEMIFASEAHNLSVSALCSAEADDLVVETYSLSKAYNVPGWRVGCIAGNRPLLKSVCQRKAYLDYGIFLPIQVAASFALTNPEVNVASTLAEYELRARTLCSGLIRIGWQLDFLPRSGCSVWAKLPVKFNDPLELATKLLQQGVAVMPGAVFGKEYSSFCRFALVQDQTGLKDVVDILNSARLTEIHMPVEVIQNEKVCSNEVQSAT